jgi:Double zinc ribbon
MFCPHCGAQLPDDAQFCFKCGSKVTGGSGQQTAGPQPQVIAPAGATSIKCPSCGAPVAPKFGEMVITCEYCGTGISLGNQGWTNIKKQTMLPLTVTTTDQANSIITPLMDRGLLHRHLHEDSVQEEMTLSYVPYWIVPVSARTSVVMANMAAQVGQTATTVALMGVILGGMGGGGFGGRRRVFQGFKFGSGPLLRGFMLRSTMAFGMGYGPGLMKAEQMDETYNFPVVALTGLTEYQPKTYQFNLDGRVEFDITKIPKGIKVLNGDVSEDVAKAQAKTLVDQLQADKAHAKYHMIQSLTTESDVGEPELLHAPIWFARYDHKGNKIVLVIDANSGKIINSMGL